MKKLFLLLAACLFLGVVSPAGAYNPMRPTNLIVLTGVLGSTRPFTPCPKPV